MRKCVLDPFIATPAEFLLTHHFPFDLTLDIQVVAEGSTSRNVGAILIMLRCSNEFSSGHLPQPRPRQRAFSFGPSRWSFRARLRSDPQSEIYNIESRYFTTELSNLDIEGRVEPGKSRSISLPAEMNEAIHLGNMPANVQLISSWFSLDYKAKIQGLECDHARIQIHLGHCVDDLHVSLAVIPDMM